MRDVDRSGAFDCISKKVWWGIGIALFSVYFSIALWGNVNEGKLDFSFVSFLSIAGVAWYFRDLRNHAWYWFVVVGLAALHAAGIAFVSDLPPLVYGHGTRGAGALLVILFDSFFVYCSIRLAERASQGWPETIEVPCRSCGKYVNKKSPRCPHCGEWKPFQSQWIILIGLAPIFCLLAFVWFFLKAPR